MAGDPQGLTLDVGGAAIPVLDAGTGPAVLLLDGGAGSSVSWQAQVPALVEAGFRVVAPDLPTVATPAGGVDLLRAVLRTLGIPRVHVVGQGGGARLGWLFAGAQAQRVDRLVVIGAGFLAPEQLCRLEIPVLAVRGASDPRVDEATLRGAREFVGGPWRDEVIAEAGEDVAAEQPGRLNDLLNDFLATGARAARPANDIRAAVGRRLGSALTERLRPGD